MKNGIRGTKRQAAFSIAVALLASSCGGSGPAAAEPTAAISAPSTAAPTTTTTISGDPTLVETASVPTTTEPVGTTTTEPVGTTTTSASPVATDTVDDIVTALTSQPHWTGDVVDGDVARCLAVGTVGLVSREALVALFVDSQAIPIAVQASYEHEMTGEQRSLVGEVVSKCVGEIDPSTGEFTEKVGVGSYGRVFALFAASIQAG